LKLKNRLYSIKSEIKENSTKTEKTQAAMTICPTFSQLRTPCSENVGTPPLWGN